MKLALIAASVLAISASPALAGGFGGPKHVTAPQFANASALNFATQIASAKGRYEGRLEQVTGAAADAVNKAKCGCKAGLQSAHAHSKNVSIQVGKVEAYKGYAKVTQSAVSTAVARNIRGGGHR